jgi:HTH-type transcriptional regulator/antitoxin HigA
MNWTIIRNEEQYRIALERIEEIFDTTNESENSDEFDLLSLLIRQYEEENYSIEEADPIAVIKMKMDYMGLRQKDLIPYFGSKSTVSKVLSYKMPLALKQVWLLSEKLELSVGLLARPYKIENRDFKNSTESIQH